MHPGDDMVFESEPIDRPEPISERETEFLRKLTYEKVRLRLIAASIQYYLKYAQREVDFKELRPFILNILNGLEAQERIANDNARPKQV